MRRGFRADRRYQAPIKTFNHNAQREDSVISRRLIAARTFASVFLAALAISLSGAAAADSYPNRIINLIVPFPPGGGADIVGRLVGQRLSTALGQPITIINHGGAGGMIGTRDIARAAPDGYTLGIMLTGMSLSHNAAYDINKDFTPIGIIASSPVVIVTNPSFQPKSLAEVVALAKKEPGKLNIGTPPPPLLNYFAAKLFNLMAKVETTIVPFTGTAPLTNGLLGNQVPIAFNTIPGVIGYVQGGQLRAIAVATEKRSAAMPDVPTATESGRLVSTQCIITGSRHRPGFRSRLLIGSAKNCATYLRTVRSGRG
jgi:tripartite-type tricarboxylate transporter receptor subunit TctC